MNSIKAKIVFVFALVIILIGGALSFISIQSSSNAVIQESMEGLSQISREGGNTADARIDTQFVYLEGLAKQEALSDPQRSLGDKMRILLDEADISPFIRIGIADLNGNLYLSDSYGIGGDIVDISERGYYSESLDGNRAIMNPSISVNPDDEGNLILVYSVPLYHENQTVGVIVAVGDGNFLSLLVDGITFGESGFAYIVDSEGRTIGHRQRDLVIEEFNPINASLRDPRYAEWAAFMETVLTEPSGVERFTLDAEGIMAGFSSIEGTDWNIIVEAFESEVLEGVVTLRNSLLLTTFILLIVGVAIAVAFARRIANPIVRGVRFAERVGSGDLTGQLDVDRGDEIGQLARALNKMQAKLKADITESARVANENLRIKSALDSVTANVMVANPDHNVIYINNAVQQMFRRGASDIRKDLPNFDPDRLVGSNIDIFHKNPTHQRQMLDALRTAYDSEIVVGGRTYALVASPISNTDGERIGTAIQWTDRTDDVAVEKEISHLVDAAVSGDFTSRIDMAGKEGFFERLGKGVNDLMRITDTSLNEVVRVLGELAQGNLTEQVVGDFQGTFGRLKDDTNHSVSKLNELIGLITESVDAINTGAKEIAAGNSDLSQRTEEQASSLEETASSMEQLTSTVKQNADNARQANQLSNQAQEVAVHGGEKTRQAMASMKAITDSADKIADIITVIDGIAFQTNILALNAAVEAARAGEQGRGFAVVAGEVRNLAQRSASAAKEIKALISEDSQTIAAGSKLVMEAGGTMEEIVNQVKRVSDLIAEISAASDEQSSGIEQVNTAITQMDEVTQQNASLVEEAAAAAESLEEQAQGLTRAVSVFKVDGHASAGSNRLAPPAAKRALPPAAGASGTRKAAPKPAPKPAKKVAGPSAAEDWEEF